MKKMNMTNPEDLQAYFMKRVESILKSKGKKLIGWDEILEGGIAPEATVMSWRGIKGGIEAAKMGHDVVMTPTTFAYLDYQQGEQTIEPPIYAGLRLKNATALIQFLKELMQNIFLAVREIFGQNRYATLHHAEYMTWPRGWAWQKISGRQRRQKTGKILFNGLKNNLNVMILQESIIHLQFMMR